jgi:hypothetical protein
MNDTVIRLDQIEQDIFSFDVSDETLETAAAATPSTTDWCRATARCTAPSMATFLAKGGDLS